MPSIPTYMGSGSCSILLVLTKTPSTHYRYRHLLSHHIGRTETVIWLGDLHRIQKRVPRSTTITRSMSEDSDTRLCHGVCGSQ